MSIPKTQVAYGYVPGKKTIQCFPNHPVQTPGDNQVLLKIEAAGMCHSDHNILLSGPLAGGKGEPKMVMGHEIAGQIVQVGKNLEKSDIYEIGGRFAVTIAKACGECEMCRGGVDNACGNSVMAYGLNCDGGFQQYLLIDNLRTLLPIPEGMSYEDAAVSTDAVLTPFHAIQKVRDLLHPTTKVLVQGLGGLGLNAVQILKSYNCNIVACDIKEESRELAKGLGAAETYANIGDSSHSIESFDLCFDFVGIDITFKNSQSYVKNHGKIVMVGLGRYKLSTLNFELARRDVEIIFNFGGTSLEQIECMKWISLGRIKPVAQVVDMEQLPNYMEKLANNAIKGRMVFRPNFRKSNL
ncbi:secondary alcohol dehydrogenase (SADH1) [Scheffersomyces stipitis CBS 6054]|uniref:Secondary alcohol dehydrogenase (SADH1) n=1 Tax=Scheffersomyces stipitis (strain ATCC 58785 / CBS 6054 / NBRC 10063 / NRRL Y-11545) TaxID=322104 RepID=A3LUA4_PICST|nr:secondary alcohol dehydrogenase (SADH1) [Scheffersomyces stipitis CBS 6054]ABN66551.1 secondary alcohol dehydrogenase (SADH1) [Scheffersomyces stipitis CBS 6054]KAG2732863.1 hypothetical protein G9P44_003853 [Scheffersomyces stipitis]